MRLSTSSFATISSAAFVGALALVGAFSHTDAGSLPKAGALRGEFQSAYENAFKAANPLKNIAIGALASLRYGLLNEASAGAIVGEDEWLFTAEELDVEPGFSANTDLSARRVAEVNAELAVMGIRLLVVALPDKSDIYADKLGFDRPAAVSERLGDFTSILDQLGVDRIDAAGVLRRARVEGDVFLRDDTHWSPRGAQAVAEAVAHRLADADIAHADVATKPLGETAFDGDLLSYAPTGPFRGLVGPSQRAIERFETTVETSGGLFGDAVVDVALVGTSFSAKPDWHFEGFLKQALGADLVNFSRVGQGPFAPMDAFLTSDVLKITPPKIVIWEIPMRYVSKELN